MTTAPTAVKIATIGGNNGGNNDMIELDVSSVSDLLKTDARFFGWSVSQVSADGAVLEKFDSGTGGKSFLPISQPELQKIYDNAKPKTMKIKG